MLPRRDTWADGPVLQPEGLGYAVCLGCKGQDAGRNGPSWQSPTPSCRLQGVRRVVGAVPVLSLGTQLDPEVLRIGIALRLEAKVCEEHRCRCGCNIDEKGYHPLSCRFSAGRFPHHAELNDVIRHALQRAGLPSVLEPPRLDRSDGRRPDGITVFPFRNGRSLVWDCTCVDTYAASHLIGAAFEPGSAGGEAEMRKRLKYERLDDAYIFEAVAIETTGVYRPSTTVILKLIDRRLVELTGEPRESVWIKQRQALAVLRGNASSILSAGRERF